MRIIALLFVPLLAFAAPPQKPAPAPTSETALARLMKGNQRYVAHRKIRPDNTVRHRRNLAVHGQHPFAVILGCADSRVPPEFVFDQGLGDLFVVREAGNIVDDDVLGSIEYAVEHLHTPLVMVLGHEKCGAVTAAVEGGEAPGHIKFLVEAIRPAAVESAGEPGDRVHNCMVANARRMARQIRESEPLLREAVASGRLKIVAATYDLTTGAVTILNDKIAAAAH